MDYLIVPGGTGRLQQVDNVALIDFIRQKAQHCRYILSVCTGIFLLKSAGLLSGKSGTTYWRALPELKQFLDINVVEQRIVKDGAIWTSGGMSSGIDIAFELIAEVAGKETAGKVQLLFEYFPVNKIYGNSATVDMLPPYQDKFKTAPLPNYIKQRYEEQ